MNSGREREPTDKTVMERYKGIESTQTPDCDLLVFSVDCESAWVKSDTIVGVEP